MEENKKTQSESQPLEDRALKAAAQFMGDELLSLLGITGTLKRIAPAEHVYLPPRDFLEDFNYEMEDGRWIHLEFESDHIRTEDLKRFRAYESVISLYCKVEVITCVLCSSSVRPLKSKLIQGINIYRVKILRLKDKDADKTIRTMERRQKKRELKRSELLRILLTPLMNGQMTQPERIARSMKILHNEREHMDSEDLERMEAVLYTLAMKFLTETELDEIRKVLSMSILGEMLIQDGIELGIERGIEQGTNKVNRLNQCLAENNRLDDILKAAEDREFQKTLFKEFRL